MECHQSNRLALGEQMGMPAMNKAAQSLGRLGGKAGTGACKARTREQARASVAARWAKTKRKPPGNLAEK